MDDQIFIQIRFTIEQDGLVLKDALIMPQSDFNTLTEQQITDMKQARFDAWKLSIQTPPPDQNDEGGQ